MHTDTYTQIHTMRGVIWTLCRRGFPGDNRQQKKVSAPAHVLWVYSDAHPLKTIFFLTLALLSLSSKVTIEYVKTTCNIKSQHPSTCAV